MHSVRTFDDAPGFGDYQLKLQEPSVLTALAKERSSARLLTPILSLEQEKHVSRLAMQTLQASGVDYGDARLGRDLTRYVRCSDTNISAHHVQESTGIGIRCLFKGFWGFAATPDLSDDGIIECAKQAVSLAKGLAACTPKDLGLNMRYWAAEPAHQAEFETPVGICPFDAPLEAWANPLLAAAEIALAVPGIKRCQGFVIGLGRRRIFSSTDGAYIVTAHSMVDSAQTYMSVAEGTSSYRTTFGPAMAGGLEHLIETDFPGKARAAAEEAVAKCAAKTPEPGDYTLILDGHNLALTMHESVGHPTELDRVLGYELGFAGGSFASLDKLGHFTYGSPIVNFTANNRIRYGCASQGYDDEGVECQSFPIIEAGKLVGYGTNRETAHVIGQDRANGTCRATGWEDPPIVRIPNLYLEPGPDKLSLEELIGDTKDGIYMMGRDSFSIDQMRMNFQFGSNMAYRIRDGKLDEPLRDVIYQSISTQFWNSCDAICDASEWQMHGVFNCGKGQPIQLSKMTHGAAPARFRNIRVGY